jgi:hypothetical protein
MSAIASLIGPAPNPAARVRTLRVGEDVLVRLREDPSRAQVALYSIPAPVPAAELVRARLAGVYRHAAHPEARWRIGVDEPGGRLLLAQIWPQAALDSTRFGLQLHEQAQRHRRWLRHFAAELSAQAHALTAARGQSADPFFGVGLWA